MFRESLKKRNFTRKRPLKAVQREAISLRKFKKKRFTAKDAKERKEIQRSISF